MLRLELTRKTELNSGKEKFVSPVFGVWRSLVARFVRDEEAAGSSPATPTGERKQHGDARGCGCCHAGVCGGIGGALGVCGWRLGVCARMLSVLVSKLGRSGCAG